jgi:long-chain fatty acid transport protein
MCQHYSTRTAFSNTRFNADLPLPAEVTAGLSVQVSEKLLLAFDYNYALWSVYECFGC